MDNSLMFAAVFLVAISIICGGMFILMLHRVGAASEARRHRRKSHRRAAMVHRAYKDTM